MIKAIREGNLVLEGEYEKIIKRYEEAERKLAVIREAFSTVTGNETMV